MTYEYICLTCNKRMSISMPISQMEREKELTRLCECGGEYRRLYSATPIVVKGKGTYTVSFPKDKK